MRCRILFCLFCAFSNLSAAGFSLVGGGKAAAVMVRPASAPAEFDAAAAFFNGELKQCTGTALPVVKEAPASGNRIVFRIEKRSVREEDAFSLDFPGENVLRITCSLVSLQWAFNHILERHLGVRWLLPASPALGRDSNHYPARKDVFIPVKAFSDRPAVPFNRLGDYRGAALARCWNAKTAFNGVHMMMVDVFSVWKYGPDQSWPDPIVPTGADGKKRVPPKMPNPSRNRFIARRPFNTGWQPCWSHPESARIAVRDILETLAKEPGRKFINLDVNDCGGCCLCSRCCAAVGGRTNSVGMPDYSPLYWKWVNDIASEVSKKYPDVIFNAIAYREVLEPPEFSLHPNVLPRICLELITLDDPGSGKRKRAVFEKWAECVSQLDLYDYLHGADYFLIPRICFHSHSRLLAGLIRDRKLRSAYFESSAQTAFQGPQQQLMLKLLWDPGLDVDRFLDDWYTAAVGKNSALWLRKYFQFWEDLCSGPEIRKTRWYQSADNIYMTLGEHNSHTFALRRGDLAKLRSFMENAVKYAETPSQKKRAAALMECFEYAELACTAAFSEYFEPDGSLPSAQAALELLKAAPKGFQTAVKYRKHPFIRVASDKGKMLEPASVSSFSAVMPFMKDPAVNAELKRLAGDPAVPASLRAQILIWLGAKPENLIENGSFETPSTLPRWGGRVPKRDTAHVSDGKYALRLSNGAYTYQIPVPRGKNYLFLCDLYLEKSSGEGRFTYKFGYSNAAKIPRMWNSYKYQVLTPGCWNTFSSVLFIPEGSGAEARTGAYASIPLALTRFERDERIWLDNLRLYCLDDLIPAEPKQ